MLLRRLSSVQPTQGCAGTAPSLSMLLSSCRQFSTVLVTEHCPRALLCLKVSKKLPGELQKGQRREK